MRRHRLGALALVVAAVLGAAAIRALPTPPPQTLRLDVASQAFGSGLATEFLARLMYEPSALPGVRAPLGDTVLVLHTWLDLRDDAAEPVDVSDLRIAVSVRDRGGGERALPPYPAPEIIDDARTDAAHLTVPQPRYGELEPGGRLAITQTLAVPSRHPSYFFVEVRVAGETTSRILDVAEGRSEASGAAGSIIVPEL